MSVDGKRTSKIVVIGAGAVGSLLGGLLARAGEDVTLIARQAHAQAIRAAGLRITGVLGEFAVQVNAAEALDFRPDLVLLAVKTQDVEAACWLAGPFIQAAPLVTLQNGVRSHEIAAALVPRANILSGVVMFNAQFLKPGEIAYARAGSLVIGEAFGENGQRVRDIQAVLNRAVPTTVSGDIHGAHWTKLLVNNVANGLEAMTGIPVRECLRYPALRKIGTLALKEGYQAIDRSGLQLAPLPGVPAPALMLIIRSPLPLAAWVLTRSMGSLKTLSSTLQSLRRGRPTEIEYLNGEIVRLGNQIGMATPYNSTVVAVVQEVARTGQFYSADELTRRFSLG